MQRMGFTAPEVDTLITKALSLSTEYHRCRPKDANFLREQQIADIEVIHRQIQASQHSATQSTTCTDGSMLNIGIGIWVCALETIEQEYIRRNPLPSRHSLFGSGSILSQLITDALGISAVNKLDDESRLIYLAELYHFDRVQSDVKLRERVEKAMATVLTRLMTSIKKLMDAVPTAEVLQTQFSTLYNRYAEKRLIPQPFYATRVHEDRPFCAQLGQVVAGLLDVNCTAESKDELDRHSKVMLGLLIYMMRTINNGNSELYGLCLEMMNGGANTLSAAAQFDCLVTLDNFLKDHSNVQLIADKGRKQFGKDNRLVNLDTQCRLISIKLEQELKILSSDYTSSMTGAKIFATAGALASYPIGYGTGSVLGTVGAGAEMKANANLKEFITRWINENAHYLLGMRGSGVGYLATTPIVTAVYQTVAGNLLGSAFALTGGLVAGGVGYLVVDLLLRSLYQYMVHSSGHYRDPLYAANFNKELLACLESLPSNLLDETKKKKIVCVTGHTHQLMLMDHQRDKSTQHEEPITGIHQVP